MKFKLREDIFNPEKRFNSAIHLLFKDDNLNYEIHHFRNENKLDSIVLIPTKYEDNIHRFIHNRMKGYKTSLTPEQFRQKYKDAIIYTLEINPEWHELSLIDFLEEQNII